MESYLLAGLDDVAALACVLLSGSAITGWWQLPQCAQLQNNTLLRRGGSRTERWIASGRDCGGPESADSSAASAVPGGRQGGQADRQDQGIIFTSAGFHDLFSFPLWSSHFSHFRNSTHVLICPSLSLSLSFSPCISPPLILNKSLFHTFYMYPTEIRMRL